MPVMRLSTLEVILQLTRYTTYLSQNYVDERKESISHTLLYTQI